MLSYHFTLRHDESSQEDLGYLAMANDDEALAFGRDVIRDIVRDHTPTYTSSALEITEGTRAVGSVAFDFEAGQFR